MAPERQGGMQSGIVHEAPSSTVFFTKILEESSKSDALTALDAPQSPRQGQQSRIAPISLQLTLHCGGKSRYLCIS